MPAKRATIYLREQVLAALGKTQDGGLSQRIAACLLRYERICRELMPELSRGEWCAIMYANNAGSDLFLAECDDYPSGTAIWANVHDSLGLGEKWEIDQSKLVGRLQKLSAAELLAVDEAIARFWNHTDLETTDDAALEAAWCRIGE